MQIVILCAMPPKVSNTLLSGSWNLGRAREAAELCIANRSHLRIILTALFGDDAEFRKRAADVARRITERDPTQLHRYADELCGLLASTPPQESRTRWHLGLVVARTAHTSPQRIRAARVLALMINDESNVTRCSVVEGITDLAIHEPSLREEARFIIHNALRTGTLAMKSRARHAERKLRCIDI